MANYKVVDSDKLDSDLKRLADIIRLKGGTIADLSFPEGMQQAVQDIQAGAVIPEGYIKPSGNKKITANGTGIDVREFETVDVEVAGSGGGGGSGDCTREHVIEVNELPTEGEPGAVYKCGDSYHQYGNEFKDVLVNIGSGVVSLVDVYQQQGASIELFSVGNYENVTDPHPSNLDTGALALYYDASREDIFFYASGAWYSISLQLEMPNGGAITDASQATTAGSYYALGEIGWKTYSLSIGSMTITENGDFDVSALKSVTVSVPMPPTTYVVGSTAELPTDAADGALAIVLGGN